MDGVQLCSQNSRTSSELIGNNLTKERWSWRIAVYFLCCFKSTTLLLHFCFFIRKNWQNIIWLLYKISAFDLTIEIQRSWWYKKQPLYSIHPYGSKYGYCNSCPNSSWAHPFTLPMFVSCMQWFVFSYRHFRPPNHTSIKNTHRVCIQKRGVYFPL